jgi:D-alanyl-D-alanine carboxypeptidase (penicillin-binding protein 5/6)
MIFNARESMHFYISFYKKSFFKSQFFLLFIFSSDFFSFNIFPALYSPLAAQGRVNRSAQKKRLDKKNTKQGNFDKKFVSKIMPEPSPTSEHFTAAIPVDVIAKYAYLIDYQTGMVLLQKRAETKMHPSSMTKIMTAYIALDRLKKQEFLPNKMFQVSRNAWRREGSTMFLNINKSVSFSDLIRGIIVVSGNDACVVLAEGLSGSEDAFAQEMNQYAKNMGLKNTHFVNATGLPHHNHYTTAKDLATLSMRTLTDLKEYYYLYSELEFKYNNIRQGNRNPLLYKKMGCDGIKTGHCDAGGYGVVASCVQNGRRLILVINGLPSLNSRAYEAFKLMNWGMNMFENILLYQKGEIIENIPIYYGEHNQLKCSVKKDAIVTLPRNGLKNMISKIIIPSALKAPIEKGQTVGWIHVESKDLCSKIEIPLIAAHEVKSGSFFGAVQDSLKILIFGES